MPNPRSDFKAHATKTSLLLNHIGFPVMEVDQEGEIVYANEPAAKFFGQFEKKLTGNLREVFPEEEALLLLLYLQRFTLNAECYVHEYFSNVTGNTIRITAKPSANTSVIITVNELRKSQPDGGTEREKDLTRHLRMLTESQLLGGIGSYDYDLATDTVAWTSNTYKIFGIPDGTPLDFNKALSVYNPSDAATLVTRSEHAFKTGQGFEMDVIIYRQSDQQERYLYIRCEVQRDNKLLISGLRGIVQDVTERKLAEKEQKKNRDLLNSIFSTSLIQMSVLKAVRNENGEITDFRIAIVNDELAKVTGRNDLVGKLYAEEYPGIREAGLFDLMLSVMETGQMAQTEYFYKRDGFENWFSCMFSKVDDGLVATNMDITQRKKADLEKIRNLALLQQSEDVAGMGSWEYNLTTGVLNWSQGMYRIFHKKESERVTPEIYGEYASEKSRRTVERVIANIKSGTVGFDETFEIKIGNEQKTIKLKASVIRNDGGEAQSVLGVDMDITQVKRAERRILDDAAMTKAIADVAPDLLYVIDVEKLAIIYANENALKLFGKTLTEINGMGATLFDRYVYPEDRPKVDEHIEALGHAIDKETKELTFRLLDNKKKPHWLSTKAVVYQRNEEGKPLHAICISQDITEQVLLQKKNEELVHEREERDKRQQKVIYDVALNTQEEERKRIAESLHNGLGQMLYGIKIYLHKLNLAENEIFSNVHRAAYVKINDLITETIKESRRLSHELTPTALDDFGLEASMKELCKSFNEFIPVKCTLSDNLNSLEKKVQISVYRIAQELLLNVFKHAGAGESHLKLGVDKKRIQLQVSDNGKGFDPEKVPDAGIGLKIINNKVKMLGGSLTIASSSTGGTRINITIPVNTL